MSLLHNISHIIVFVGIALISCTISSCNESKQPAGNIPTIEESVVVEGQDSKFSQTNEEPVTVENQNTEDSKIEPQISYHRDNIFAPEEIKRQGPDFEFTKVSNSEQQRSSITRLGEVEDAVSE